MIHFSFWVCMIRFYISVSHAKKKRRYTFLACMLCFPKSGNLPFDISLIMHTYARACTCTDDIWKEQFSRVPSCALNWEKHTEHKSKKGPFLHATINSCEVTKFCQNMSPVSPPPPPPQLECPYAFHFLFTSLIK